MLSMAIIEGSIVEESVLEYAQDSPMFCFIEEGWGLHESMAWVPPLFDFDWTSHKSTSGFDQALYNQPTSC